MKFFSSSFALYVFSITFVQAIPTSIEGLLGTSSKAIMNITPGQEHELRVAEINKLGAELESKTAQTKIENVNEMWGTKRNVGNQESNPMKTHRVSFNPDEIPQDSKTIVNLEEELELAELNKLDAESDSTTALAEIDEVNEIWRNNINEKINPLKPRINRKDNSKKAGAVTFDPTLKINQ
jgi:hypothetical protein